MIKLFKYNQETKDLDLNCDEILLINEFKEVWDNDTTDTKEDAFKIFKYVFLKNDITIRNPYKEFVDDPEFGIKTYMDKHNLSREEALKSYTEDMRLSLYLDETGLTREDAESEIVLALEEKYRSITRSSAVLSMLEACKANLNKLKVRLRTTDYEAKLEQGPNKGKHINDPLDSLRLIEKSEVVIDQIKSLEKRAEDELQEDVEIRGDGEVGAFNV